MSSIAIVVPTIREECLIQFKRHWKKQLEKHTVKLIVVRDGENPTLTAPNGVTYTVEEIMGESNDLVYNLNDGVRNLGFAYIAQCMPDIQVIGTLDDDVVPYGDSIGDHLRVLDSRVPVSWISTASEYMRGFPYELRSEAEVVLSHGVWEGVKDWDAPTQLVSGNRDIDFFYKGAIPKGIFYPMSGMNVFFKRKMLPFMYWAPMGPRIGMDRFADIWAGIESKKVIDKKGWAVVSGYSKVKHERASNVWKNLQKEIKGLELNESFWKGDESDPYFKLYREQRKRWEKFICKSLK